MLIKNVDCLKGANKSGKILPGAGHLIPQDVQIHRSMKIETTSVFFKGVFSLSGLGSGTSCVHLVLIE